MSNEVKKTLQELKVSELKTELEKRGLDKNGVKVTLCERLEKALTTEGHDPKTYQFTIVADALPSPSPVRKEPPKKAVSESKEDAVVEEAKVEEPIAVVDEASTKAAVAQNGDKKDEKVVGAPSEAQKAEEQLVEVPDNEENEALELVEEVEVEETEEVSQESLSEPPKAVEVTSSAPPPVAEPTPMDTTEPAKEEHAEDEQVAPPEGEAKTEVQKENVEELDYEPSEQTEEKKAEMVHEEAESEDQNVEVGSVATVASKPAAPDAEKKDHSLWIRGLPNSIKAADLKAAFSKYGKVVTSKIFTTKNKQAPTCFGYITMGDAESAKLCLQNLHRTNLKGRIINVEPADKMFPSKTPAKVVKEGVTTSTGDDKNEGTEKKDEKKDDKKDDKKDSARKPVVYRSGRERAGPPRRVDALRSRRTIVRPGLPSKRGLGSTGGRSVVSRMIRSRVALIRREERDQYRREVPPLMEYRSRGASSYGRSSSSSLAYRLSRSGRDTRRPRSPPRYESERAVEKARVERDRMREIMRRREEEHRKREEELRLERERERIRFEREKLEREKLELQQLKQLAALATQAPAAYAPMVAVPQPMMGLSSGSSRDRERERDRAKKAEPRRSGGSTSRRSRSPMARRSSPPRGSGYSSRGRGTSSRGRGGSDRYESRREPTAAEKYAAYEREMAERGRGAYPSPRKEEHRDVSYASRGSSGRGDYHKSDPRGGYDARKMGTSRGVERTNPRDTRAYDSRTSSNTSAPYSSSTRSDPYASSRSTGYSTSRDATFAHPDPYSAAAKAAPGYTDRYRNESLPATYRDTQNYGSSNQTWASQGQPRGSTWADTAAGSSYGGSASATNAWGSSGRQDTWHQQSYGSSSQGIPSRGYDPYSIKSNPAGRRY